MEKIFDNWKDSPGGLTFETLITILTIENLNSDNRSYLTINCDTGQHSQFLRCLYIMVSQLFTRIISFFTRIISFLLKIIVAVAEEHDLDFYALYTR